MRIERVLRYNIINLIIYISTFKETLKNNIFSERTIRVGSI
jgi:hypothetical protein